MDPQGAVFPRHEHVCGSDVHLLLVLRYCGHGHRGDDLQVHRVPGVTHCTDLVWPNFAGSQMAERWKLVHGSD